MANLSQGELGKAVGITGPAVSQFERGSAVPRAKVLSAFATKLDVPVPLGCEAIIVQLRRKESLMFDNKISGDYWLDAVTSEFDRIQY